MNNLIHLEMDITESSNNLQFSEWLRSIIEG